MVLSHFHFGMSIQYCMYAAPEACQRFFAPGTESDESITEYSVLQYAKDNLNLRIRYRACHGWSRCNSTYMSGFCIRVSALKGAVPRDFLQIFLFHE